MISLQSCHGKFEDNLAPFGQHFVLLTKYFDFWCSTDYGLFWHLMNQQSTDKDLLKQPKFGISVEIFVDICIPCLPKHRYQPHQNNLIMDTHI